MSDPYDGEDLTNKWRQEQHEEDLEEIRKAKEKLERKRARERAESQAQEAQTHDTIHHPNHYSWRGMECIDFIKAFVRKQVNGFWACCEANILKYLYRWGRKNRVEDLKKAREYLDMLIKDVEENGGKE